MLGRVPDVCRGFRSLPAKDMKPTLQVNLEPQASLKPLAFSLGEGLQANK